MENKKSFSGKIEWIGLRAEKIVVPIAVEQAVISVEEGLVGDHYSGKSKRRQVTLIQKEHFDVVAKLLGVAEVDPKLLRRNIVVSGINLLSLKNAHFSIGGATLRYTGQAYPCNRMDENLGEGGLHAMEGHGGITATVIKGGEIRLGDKIELLPEIED